MLLLDSGVSLPTSAYSSGQGWYRAVKIFESSNMATLETDINDFINGLRTSPKKYALLGVSLVPGQGANLRVVIPYGFFDPP